MHGVVRRYRGASALTDALAGRSQEVRDLIGGVPGFVACDAVRAGGGPGTAAVRADRAGRRAFAGRTAGRVRLIVAGAAPTAPAVVEGRSSSGTEPSERPVPAAPPSGPATCGAGR